MALTATAQSALPREPTWDEAIVPALRKRLKDESNVLAKRISAASIASNELEEQLGQYYAARPGTSTSSHSFSKPSAIPRPSTQSSRTADSSSAGVYSGALPRPSQRPRAISQPYIHRSSSRADSPPMSDNTRPISPVNAPKGTRIPVSRNRTGSMSSQTPSTYNGTNGRPNGTVGHSKQHAEPSDSQLYPVEERRQAESQTSRSTVRLPRHKVSDIFQEQAPFNAQSLASSLSQLDHGRMTPDRVSSDSDEHPFEHWYRGDVARNGGVGELRVARRQEMLDIANYGHTLKKASGKQLHSGMSSRSRSNSRGRDMPHGRSRARQRADSVGARESFYIDQEEMDAGAAVMDERPLTDLEDDGYEDHVDDYYSQAVQHHPNGSISSPSLDRSDTPTSRTTQNTSSRSRIPQPSSRSRATTPTAMKPTRSASESGMAGPSSASPQMSRSPSQPKTQQGLPPTGSSVPSTPTAKRRAKSPANAASASASKKPKAPPSAMQKRQDPRNEANRRSIGQYPMPDGDEDAIPTWTQPKPANGNWDDVVLPVVARKKGLQDQFETADGSPRPKDPEPVVIEPAPGTFGYDITKYRKRYKAPRTTATAVGAPIDQRMVSQPSNSLPLAKDLSNSTRGESPPPFSHYTQSVLAPPSPQPQVHAMQPMAADPHMWKPQQPVVEEESGGCCKCVIM
ncbi:hypothetical protein C8Q80DRAFT_1350339 [Daedaleopsis nitida]|nr:hypothetical protein C8Q80DRAFT_1350339 [Daedaleopsis nitida]